VKPGTGTTVLVATLFVVFSVELASHGAGNETLLLKFGALPYDGGVAWRILASCHETHKQTGDFREV
jgi:hypothetical protein